MASNGLLPASVWPSKTLQAPKLVDALGQVTDFLDKLGYKKTVKALAKESIDKGTPVNLAEWRVGDRMVPVREYLGTLYMDILLQDEEDSDREEEQDSDEAEDSSASEDESSESSSESEDETEKAIVIKPAAAAAAKAGSSKKRPREVEPESSDSDSSDSEDSDDAPPAKKAKNDSTSEAESSDDDSSSSEADEAASASSDSDSSSDESDTSDEPAPVPKPPNKKLKTVAKIVSQPTTSTSSASSGTLAGSPQPPVVEASTMHPARQQRMEQNHGGAKGKKGAAGSKSNEPFSRIPKDTRVDPRFASNAYVPYDYADKAHQDLIVTKGKGFTKEKNKKKRGSYRGGMIDTTPKGIKFDD